MSHNADLMEANAKAFIAAHKKRIITLEQSKLHNDLYLHADKPNNIDRFTYAILDSKNKRKIIAVCTFIFAQETNGLYKWSIGWYVALKHRNKGLGSLITKKAIQDFHSKLEQKTTINLIEANVDLDNIPSLKIAEKLIGNQLLLNNRSYSFIENIEEIVNSKLNKFISNFLTKKRINDPLFNTHND